MQTLKRFPERMRTPSVVILVVNLLAISSAEVFVVTKNGPIRGTASLRDDVDAFLGVPFAEPPLGDLRFAKPVPKKPWTKTYDASRFSAPCSQFVIKLNFSVYFMPEHDNNSEDCLYLNIWTPKDAPTGNLRPVYIYFHHGSFSHGSAIQFDGSNLASGADMVVVTVNYRLGSMGFFLAFIEEANGNMGMYDQLMAIQWMKDNAEAFGGDPENIILSGSSSGALSVGVHLVSPLTQKLFRKAHFTSGSIINPVYLDVNEKLFKNSERIAFLAGCTNRSVTLRDHPRAVVDCMKSKPKDAILSADISVAMTHPAVFYPRVGDAFLPKEATLLYREGKFRSDVSVLYGTGANEGGLMVVSVLHSYIGVDGKIPMTALTKKSANMIGRFGAKLGGLRNPGPIISHYMDSVRNESSQEYLYVITRAIGDFTVACGTVFLSDFLSLKGNQVYYYKLAFKPVSSPLAKWLLPTHLDDVQYIFGNPYFDNFTAEEVALSKRFMDRISSFGRTGNPNIPEEMPWMKYSYRKPFYLHIGQEEESIRLRPYNVCEIFRSDFKSEIDPDLIQRFSQSNSINSDPSVETVQSNLICNSIPTLQSSLTLLLVCFCLTVSRSAFSKLPF